MCWSPEEIQHDALREYAHHIRDGQPRWVRTSDLCARFYVTPGAVQQWVQKGLIRTVRYKHYWFWEPEVDAFVPPCM